MSATPVPFWQAHNVYRARPIVDSAATNLQVGFADVCYAGCDPASMVQVTTTIANNGPSIAPAGIPVAEDGRVVGRVTPAGVVAALASGSDPQ